METIQILTNSFQDNAYVSILTAVVTLASAIAAVTGTPKKGTIWAKLYSVLDFLALNVYKAKDK